MQQLSGLDASFLSMETATTFGHVGGVTIFEPDASGHNIEFEQVRHLIAERLPLLPPYTKRLVEVPFGLDRPWWIEDPDFDLEFHVREIALPAPGNREQLAEQVARIHSRPLDRARPLWEMYFIEGLEGGAVALYTKTHHAAIDGVSGTELMTVMLDTSPKGSDIEVPSTPRQGETPPTPFELLGRSLSSAVVSPRRAMRMQRNLARAGMALAASRAARGARRPGNRSPGCRSSATFPSCATCWPSSPATATRCSPGPACRPRGHRSTARSRPTGAGLTPRCRSTT